jgi:hypothetical protein
MKRFRANRRGFAQFEFHTKKKSTNHTFNLMLKTNFTADPNVQISSKYTELPGR